MSRQFEITIIIDVADDTTVEHVKAAMLYLTARAARRSPDARLDWMRAHVDVDIYVGNGQSA